jgi:predicted PurR-regulated permease PerM
VVVAADYPFLDVFWTMIVFFAWIVWISLMFHVFADVFRRHDIGGGAKVLWLLFVILLPFLGVFVYLISQSASMAERGQKQAMAAQSEMDDYVRSVAASSDPAEQIAKAKQLLDSGAIDQSEFDALKQKALA